MIFIDKYVSLVCVYILFFKGRMEYPPKHFRLVLSYSHGYFMDNAFLIAVVLFLIENSIDLF